MTPPRQGLEARIRNGLIWASFALALVLATSPVWRPLAYGFSPSFDQLARLARCINPGSR